MFASGGKILGKYSGDILKIGAGAGAGGLGLSQLFNSAGDNFNKILIILVLVVIITKFDGDTL